MTRSLDQDYLETVLGWKTLPDSLPVPQPPPKKIFAVYAPSPDPEEERLLKKMMAAIGVMDFQVVTDAQAGDDFMHVLSFHSETIQTSSARVWLFPLLSAYLHGDPREVSRLKKEAWEKLKRFRQEVLS